MTSNTAHLVKTNKTPRDLSMTKTPLDNLDTPLKKSFVETFGMDEVRGNISISCDAVGINRQTFYNWMKNDTNFNDAVQEAQARLRDDMESVLVNRGVDNSDAALIFWLKNRHPDYKQNYNTLVQVNIKPILGGESVHSNNSDQKTIEVKEEN